MHFCLLQAYKLGAKLETKMLKDKSDYSCTHMYPAGCCVLEKGTLQLLQSKEMMSIRRNVSLKTAVKS